MDYHQMNKQCQPEWQLKSQKRRAKKQVLTYTENLISAALLLAEAQKEYEEVLEQIAELKNKEENVSSGD